MKFFELERIDAIVNHLIFNPTLNTNPALATGQRQTPLPYLKFQFTKLICEMSGGAN